MVRSPPALAVKILAFFLAVSASAVAFPAATSAGGTLAARAAAGPKCAATRSATSPQTATAGAPCWVDVNPYPFTGTGVPTDQANCSNNSVAQCLLVTSFAFRAWNRGLAATPNGGAFGVWLYNGTRWFPDPTFPGTNTCKGNTVLWAGKLDYWLIGSLPNTPWISLCRFDGVDFLWEPLKLPAATLARETDDSGHLKPGGITSGTCLSWDNCWFFGNDGVVVHWDGTALTDDSTDASKPWLAADFADAVARSGSSGDAVGAAVGKSIDLSGKPLPIQPGGAPAAQLFTLSGDHWTPTAFPQLPSRTDLVSLDLDSSGHGWAAGNPAGHIAGEGSSPLSGTPAVPSPLIPIVPGGADPGCKGPAPDRFTFSGLPGSDSYLWSSVATVPGSGDAIAGGTIRPADDGTPRTKNNNDGSQEPVLAQVTCQGHVTVTRFTATDTTPSPCGDGGIVAAGRRALVEAVAANATNDAWAATSAGALDQGTCNTQSLSQGAHIYHLTDGTPPRAPAGDDLETRPLQLQQDPPIIVFAALPPPPPPPPAQVSPTIVQSSPPRKPLPPAIANVRAKLAVQHRTGVATVRIKGHAVHVATTRRTFTLHLSFNVRRPVTLGLMAFHKGHRVGLVPLTRFKRKRGQLVLRLTRAHWPTRLAFLTDTPKVTLAKTGSTLAGTVALHATASAIKGRTIASVRFDESPAGKNAWTAIATATTAPFRVTFDTTKVTAGAYDLRAVAVDSAGSTAVSAVRRAHVQGGPAG